MNEKKFMEYAQELYANNISLRKQNDELFESRLKYIEECANLKRQIRIKDKWCQLIIDIGFDYDGYNDSENLKKIIDELVEYSHRAIDSDDKTIAYVGGGDGKVFNILSEEIAEANNDN